MSGTCRHGRQPGPGQAITVHGARERRVDEHEKQCPGAVLFNHRSGFGHVICCATCRKKVA